MTLVDPTNTEPANATSAGIATLKTLLDALGSGLLQVLAAPRGLDLPVVGTAIYDPADPMPDGPGCVLLLVGTRVDSPDTSAILRAARDHGYVAVVTKARGSRITDLATLSEELGLTVLGTADDVPWRHLDGLLVSVLGARRLAAETTTSGGEALFALANALGATIGGSVAIEDLEQHVIAYSSFEGQRIDPLRERGILDRQVPDYPHHSAQYLHVLRAEGVSRFPAVDDELPRAAVAVRAGDLPLGTIWAIEGELGLDPSGEQALLDSARIAAMHMLRSQDVTERDQHLRGEVLRAVLAGARTFDDGPERLGLATGAEVTLIAFALNGPDQQVALVTRIGIAAARYVSAYRPEAVTTTTTQGVYALVPGSGDAVRRLASGALPSLRQAAGAVVRAAVSAPTQDLTQLPQLRAETEAVLRAAGADAGAPLVAGVADVHARILLDQVSQHLARDPRMRHPGIQELTDHDRDHGTEYAFTVRTWLDCQGDVSVTASHLHIHPNTLRYRLRRVEDRFDLDLADSDTRLSIWLQLRLASSAPGLQSRTAEIEGSDR